MKAPRSYHYSLSRETQVGSERFRCGCMHESYVGGYAPPAASFDANPLKASPPRRSDSLREIRRDQLDAPANDHQLRMQLHESFRGRLAAIDNRDKIRKTSLPNLPLTLAETQHPGRFGGNHPIHFLGPRLAGTMGDMHLVYKIAFARESGISPEHHVDTRTQDTGRERSSERKQV